MKKLFVFFALVGVVCIALPACEQKPEAGQGGQEANLGEGGIPKDAVRASSFDSDVPPLRPDQSSCFVCPEGPIDPEIYVDVTVDGEKKRIYFHSEECKKNFQQNKEQWMKGVGDR